MPAPEGRNPHRNMTAPKRQDPYHPEARGLSGEMLDAMIRQAYTAGRNDQQREDGAQQVVTLPTVFDQGWDAAIAHERERILAIVREEVVDTGQAVLSVVRGSHLAKETKREVAIMLRDIEQAMVKIIDPDRLVAQAAAQEAQQS